MGDYGPGSEDVRNSLNATGIYALPFGKTRRFGSNWNTLTDQVLGGWQISGNAILYSGFPIKISTPIRYDVYANTAHSIHYRPLRVQHRPFRTGSAPIPPRSPV